MIGGACIVRRTADEPSGQGWTGQEKGAKLSTEVREMHEVTLFRPRIAAPGEAVASESAHDITAGGDGIRIVAGGPVGTGGDLYDVAGRVNGALHVFHVVDIDCRALTVLGFGARAPSVAAHVLDGELFVALKDFLKDGLNLVSDGLVDLDGADGRGGFSDRWT